MIAAISKQVRKDIVRFPKSTPSDVTFKGTRLDENDNDVEYNDDFVDTGGFEASGIGKPAEPSSFHPVERPQPPFGEFAWLMMTLMMTTKMTMVIMTMMMTMTMVMMTVC